MNCTWPLLAPRSLGHFEEKEGVEQEMSRARRGQKGQITEAQSVWVPVASCACGRPLAMQALGRLPEHLLRS